MPSDALGPDAPLGDNDDSQNSLPEDFLGLDGSSVDADLDALASPLATGPDMQAAALEPVLEASQSTELTPGADSPPLTQWGDASELQLSEEPDPLSEFVEDDGQQHSIDSEEAGESASWLMEFDPADMGEESEEAFVDALYGDEEGGLQEVASGGNPWLGRALIATVSVFLGVVGSKFVFNPAGSKPNTAPSTVAQMDPSAPTPGSENPASDPGNPGELTAQTTGNTAVGESQAAGGASPTAKKPRSLAMSRGGKLTQLRKNGRSSRTGIESGAPVAGGEASPTPELPDPAIQAPAPGAQVLDPAIAVDWLAPEPGRERRTQEIPVEDMVTLPPESEGGLRRATPAELSKIWMGSAIPTEAIARKGRLMTPGVGRVRVVLASGEVFEGNLYAVGSKKVWLETTDGRMALLDYQIDRVEHIVGSEGDKLLGSDSSSDLNGLQGVRVRTVGGVFYGKLISHEGTTVVLGTESGGRITLKEAVVEVAGKSATQLLNADGATAKVEANPKTPGN